ncbi:MAG: hypothetical protein J3Q66DRAFT_438287 [Benniella sp.]|nr:MAG: hypothetical protein J3Q66DRAFT_438287 [Benniella sp.]
MSSPANSIHSGNRLEPSIDTLIPTFRFMAHRKLRRKAHGQYRRHSNRRYVFSAVIIALFMSLIGIGAQKLELATSWPELALIIIILIVMIYVVVKVSIIIRWCFYWQVLFLSSPNFSGMPPIPMVGIMMLRQKSKKPHHGGTHNVFPPVGIFFRLVLATLVLFAINRGSLFDQFKPGEHAVNPESDKKLATSAKIVLIVLAFMEALTLGTVVLFRVAYPRIILRASWLNCKRWWRIRESPQTSSMSPNYRTITFSYLSWDPDEYVLQRSTVTYVGEYDESGKPHGLGEWTDHTYTGEALQGIWEHGIPIGPFKSQEYGTGNAFCSIRIGYCKNTMDKDGSTVFGAARDPDGPSYGAATVECSVSGKFFHHLPNVRVIGKGILRSELEQKAKANPAEPFVMAYPLSFLLTFAESLQCRPSIRGSFRGTSSKKSAPLSKSIVVRYTDRGIFIPGYIKSRRKTDVNEVVIRRVCSPNMGVEGLSIEKSEATGGNVSGTHTPVPVLQLPSKGAGTSSNAGSAGEDSDTSAAATSSNRFSILDPIRSPENETDRKFERDRKRRHNQTGLVVDGWRQVLDVDGRTSTAISASRAGYEALVFVHGYNCALTYGIGRLGQLLSLGEFPPYIKPFVFNWPSSTTLGYFTAKSVGCSDAVAKDLRQFIVDLRDAGFTRIHILAHSMGARIVLSALRKGYFDGAFAEREVDVEPSTHGVDKEQLQSRKSVRYRDTLPGRGGPAPVMQGSSIMRHSSDDPNQPIQLATFILLNPDADLDIFLEDDYWVLSKFCPHITLYADARDGALFWSEVLGRKKSLGRHPRTLVYTPTGEALDVDVIDTTSLDVNIHSIRHNFFNLNRLLVDDLYDVVVLGRRAREREGRLSSRWTFSPDGTENGEVFTFLCAPSYVVNK